MTGYRTIVADPPWEFTWRGGPGGRRRNLTHLGYETMSVEEIIRCVYEPHALLWHADATLFLWVTQDILHRGSGQEVAQRWGFHDRVGEFIWRKPNFGAGAFPRIGHETCLIYRRGKGSLRPDAARNVHSVREWKQRYDTNSGKTHSAKPDGFYDDVERGYEGPYLEMFARRARFGWSYWGDQSLNTADLFALGSHDPDSAASPGERDAA